ncbi:MAG: UbiX family flavin prenyltransferase [Thermincolia bacterium]
MKLIVAITGASGAIYGIRILAEAQKKEVETHLVISKWAKTTIEKETNYTVEEVKELANFCYEDDDLAAPIASGSFKCDGMIVAPCSMKTLSGIANGYTEGLIVRASDVAMKEKRRLVLITRETPLNPIHLENMLKLSKLGVTVMPPVPAFYTKPETIDDIINQTVGRVLDQFDIEIDFLRRWGG